MLKSKLGSLVELMRGSSLDSTVLELRTIAAFCDDFVTELRADVFSYGIPVLVGMLTRGVGSAGRCCRCHMTASLSHSQPPPHDRGPALMSPRLSLAAPPVSPPVCPDSLVSLPTAGTERAKKTIISCSFPLPLPTHMRSLLFEWGDAAARHACATTRHACAATRLWVNSVPGVKLRELPYVCPDH